MGQRLPTILGKAIEDVVVTLNQEYDEERIPGAQLLPLTELTVRYDELPKDREIVAQCRSGKRSAQATEFLRDQGYDVTNLEGGILRWKAEGLPTEQG